LPDHYFRFYQEFYLLLGKAEILLESPFTYHPNGTITFKNRPNEVVAIWRESREGGFDISALPKGAAHGASIRSSPRSLADDFILGWLQAVFKDGGSKLT
jgi:hypothetical protein